MGYRLAVDPQSVDARRFEALVAEGRPAEALELWRGPALEEFASAPVARTEAARLDELALVATEEAVDAELARGRHAEVVGRLRALVAAHPLRERLWSQLMVALYRAGRGAEALGAYRELRGRLADELGIDPSPALRRLSEAVAVQDPSLDWRPPRACLHAHQPAASALQLRGPGGGAGGADQAAGEPRPRDHGCGGRRDVNGVRYPSFGAPGAGARAWRRCAS